MNELSTYSNPNFGEVRTLTVNGEPWFVGKDVAEILGYKDTSDALKKHVDEDDKGVGDLPTPGGKQKTIIINESGLYSLILSSKLPTAKEFKRWVTSEVLPAIRKTGGYNAGYSKEEVRDIIAQETTRMIVGIYAQLGFDEYKNFTEKPPKRDRTKIGLLPPEDRQKAEEIIKNNTYEEAVYQIRQVMGLRIGETAVRYYARKHGLR